MGVLNVYELLVYSFIYDHYIFSWRWVMYSIPELTEMIFKQYSIEYMEITKSIIDTLIKKWYLKIRTMPPTGEDEEQEKLLYCKQHYRWEE